MEDGKKIKRYVVYLLICLVLIFPFSMFIYDKYFSVKISDFHDIYIGDSSIEVPHDVLLKEYKNYEELLSNIFDGNKLNEVIGEIGKDSFDEYDFIASFYQTKMCTKNLNKPYKLEQNDDKVILTIERKEKEKCDLETRVSFIPVEKGKYNVLPTVIIQKKTK